MFHPLFSFSSNMQEALIDTTYEINAADLTAEKFDLVLRQALIDSNNTDTIINLDILMMQIIKYLKKCPLDLRLNKNIEIKQYLEQIFINICKKDSYPDTDAGLTTIFRAKILTCTSSLVNMILVNLLELAEIENDQTLFSRILKDFQSIFSILELRAKSGQSSHEFTRIDLEDSIYKALQVLSSLKIKIETIFLSTNTSLKACAYDNISSMETLTKEYTHTLNIDLNRVAKRNRIS